MMPFRLMILMAMFSLVFNTTGCGEAAPDPVVDETDETDTTDETTDDTTDEATDEEEEPTGPVPCDAEGTNEICEGVTEGSCSPGKRWCEDGFWTECDNRRVPMPKLCDAYSCLGAGEMNEGCECLVGTSRDCYDGDPTTIGVGTCRPGRQACVVTEAGSEWGACENQVLPQAEDCSGRNLDCFIPNPDNPEHTPDDCSCTNGATRDCGGITTGSCQLGTQTCSGGEWGACVGDIQPAGDCSELNCAGELNPGCDCVIGETQDCYTGPLGTESQGTCAAGTRTCGPQGTWGQCLDQEHPLPNCDESCTGTLDPVCL